MSQFLRSVLLFSLLTAVMTYPQALHLTDTVHDEGDPLLNTWTLAWVAHRLPTSPAHLFDANIFVPEHTTLAYSETLLLPAIAAAPLRWIGLGPILVYNLVFLGAIALSGAGTALLVKSLTGSTGAGVLAGIVFAFLPFRVDHAAHLQLQQTQCLPLALWSFHRLLTTGRLRDGLLFGLFAAGQALSCVYYGLFLVPYFAVVCGTLLIAERAMSKPRAFALAAAALVAVLAVAPLGLAYLSARKVVGERPPAVLDEGSARLGNYLAVHEKNVVYGSVLARFGDAEHVLFPGFVALGLAVLALRPPLSPPRIAYVLGLLIALDMSLGIHGFTYRMLFDNVLPFRGIRVPARMGVIVGFSVAVLAGYGAARIAATIVSPRTRRLVLAAVGVLMLAEYATRPLEALTVSPPPPAAYADLAQELGNDRTATILEFPISTVDDAMYMYYSTFHWQPMLNGYSGFFPPSYTQIVEAVKLFPDEASIAAIKARGVRYLLIHGERLYGDRYDEVVRGLDRRTDLAMVSRSPSAREGQHGEISIYRIVR